MEIYIFDHSHFFSRKPLRKWSRKGSAPPSLLFKFEIPMPDTTMGQTKSTFAEYWWIWNTPYPILWSLVIGNMLCVSSRGLLIRVHATWHYTKCITPGGELPLWESVGMRRGFAPHFRHLDDLFAPHNLTMSTILFRSCWVPFRSPTFSACRRSFCPPN